MKISNLFQKYAFNLDEKKKAIEIEKTLHQAFKKKVKGFYYDIEKDDIKVNTMKKKLEKEKNDMLEKLKKDNNDLIEKLEKEKNDMIEKLKKEISDLIKKNENEKNELNKKYSRTRKIKART